MHGRFILGIFWPMAQKCCQTVPTSQRSVILSTPSPLLRSLSIGWLNCLEGNLLLLVWLIDWCDWPFFSVQVVPSIKILIHFASISSTFFPCFFWNSIYHYCAEIESTDRFTISPPARIATKVDKNETNHGGNGGQNSWITKSLYAYLSTLPSTLLENLYRHPNPCLVHGDLSRSLTHGAEIMSSANYLSTKFSPSPCVASRGSRRRGRRMHDWCGAIDWTI